MGQVTRTIPVTVIGVDDKGTPERDDDVVTQRTEFRIEVYDDGVDPNTPGVQPREVYASEDDVLDDSDTQVAAQRVEGNVVIDSREALESLFAERLQNAYPGGADFDGAIDPALVEAMPSVIAAALVESLENGETTLAYLDDLTNMAANDPDPNARARAAAALFGVALTHLDEDPARWSEVTGFDFLGDYGGNCATFIAVAFLYAGFTRFSDLRVDPDGTMGWQRPPVPDNLARGAAELLAMFQARAGEEGEIDELDQLRLGDLMYTDGDPHISMVVGFGPPDGGRLFLSFEDAQAYYGDDVVPYVVDHDPSNVDGSRPRPYTEVDSGGEWSYASVGNPVDP